MTPQEILNKSYEGVMAQGCKAMTAYGTCSYQSVADGVEVRCAIGHLLDNDSRMLSYKGSVKGAVDRHPRFNVPAYFTTNMDLLQDLQEAHDQADKLDFMPSFEARVREVASKHGLTVPSYRKECGEC